MGLVTETAPRTASNVVTTTYTKVGLPTTVVYTPHTLRIWYVQKEALQVGMVIYTPLIRLSTEC